MSALATACVSVPQMKPFVEGLPPRLPSAAEHHHPSALDLPRIDLASTGGAGRVGRPPYRVGPLDKISVLVWKHPELGSQVPADTALRITVVGEDGAIGLPFLAPVTVAGKTVGEITAVVQSRYSEVLQTAQVETYLESCASQTVEVNGEVQKPGTHYLCNNVMTVGEVLRAAGGLTAAADAARGVLSREGTVYQLNLRGTNPGDRGGFDVIVQAGDSLYFPAAQERVVFVFGEVARAGVFPIPPKGMSLVEAIGQAGGFNTTTAKVNSVYLARINDVKPIVYKMKLSDLLRNEEVPLTAGDRVFVPPSGLARWSRWWKQLIPVSSPERYVQP